MFDRGEEKVVVYAYELFTSSSGDIKKDAALASDMLDSDSTIIYEYTDISKDGFEAVKIIPSSFNMESDAILLRSALVKTQDNLLIVVSVYANPEKFKNRNNCINLADEILDTLRLGSRTVNKSKRVEELWLCEIEIQEGYTITLNRGVDFDVYYIRKIVGIDNPTQPTMGIYMGWHPSGIKVPEGAKVEKTADKILNQNIEWISYEEDGILRAETIFGVTDEDYLMMHIFISSDNEKDLETLKVMARTLAEKSNAQ